MARALSADGCAGSQTQQSSRDASAEMSLSGRRVETRRASSGGRRACQAHSREQAAVRTRGKGRSSEIARTARFRRVRLINVQAGRGLTRLGFWLGRAHAERPVVLRACPSPPRSRPSGSCSAVSVCRDALDALVLRMSEREPVERGASSWTGCSLPSRSFQATSRRPA